MIARSEVVNLIGEPFIAEKDGYAFYPVKYFLNGDLIDFANYLVGDSGQVFSIKANKFLKPSLDKDGYSKVCLYNEGKKFNCYIHKIVGSTFYWSQALPLIESGDMVFDHINRDKSDNSIANIRPTTLSINNKNISKDAYKKRQENMRKNRLCYDSRKSISVDGKVFNSIYDATEYFINNGVDKHREVIAKNISNSLRHNYKCYGKIIEYMEVVK